LRFVGGEGGGGGQFYPPPGFHGPGGAVVCWAALCCTAPAKIYYSDPPLSSPAKKRITRRISRRSVHTVLCFSLRTCDTPASKTDDFHELPQLVLAVTAGSLWPPNRTVAGPGWSRKKRQTVAWVQRERERERGMHRTSCHGMGRHVHTAHACLRVVAKIKVWRGQH